MPSSKTISSTACLTTENWRDCGVRRLSYRLADLLIKPGYEVLQSVPSLADYVGWPDELVLDVSMPGALCDDGVRLHSSYDGSIRYYSFQQLIDLIVSLQPDSVLLPQPLQFLAAQLPETTRYLEPNEGERMRLSTEQAIQDAFAGVLYHPSGVFSITSPDCSTDFSLIDIGCVCPTCQDGLTRAYLHHLYSNTPLLCHRFLAMHNISYLREQ